MHNDSEALIQLPLINQLTLLWSLYRNSVHLDKNVVEVISDRNILNLYHIVFNEKYTEVRVFNNKRDQVWGPTALQENHDDHAMLL